MARLAQWKGCHIADGSGGSPVLAEQECSERRVVVLTLAKGVRRRKTRPEEVSVSARADSRPRPGRAGHDALSSPEAIW